jgi:hypothetical protein
MIREHARRGAFPVDKITRIEVIIDPTTAEVPHKARETSAGSAAS